MTSGVYSSFASRPANKAFVATYEKLYTDGKRPDFETADAWDGMSAIFDLVKATKGKFTGEEASPSSAIGRRRTARKAR